MIHRPISSVHYTKMTPSDKKHQASYRQAKTSLADKIKVGADTAVMVALVLYAVGFYANFYALKAQEKSLGRPKEEPTGPKREP